MKMKIKLLKSSPTPQCHKTCYTLPMGPNQSRGNFEVLEIQRFVTNLYCQKLFFSLFLTLFPLSLLGAQPPLLVSLEQVVRRLLWVVGGQDLAVQSWLASRLQQEEMCRYCRNCTCSIIFSLAWKSPQLEIFDSGPRSGRRWSSASWEMCLETWKHGNPF